jgi:hypothetical protein
MSFSLSLSRYGDFSWNGHGSWISCKPYLTDHNTNIRTGDTLYGSVADQRVSEGIDLNKRNIGAFNMNNINIAFPKQSSSKRKLKEFQEGFQWLFNHNSIKTQTKSRPIEPSFNTELLHGRGRERTGGEEQNVGKRKGFHDEIDLSLSLSIRSRQEEDKRISWIEGEVDSSTLSLSWSSSSKKGNYSIDLNMPSKLSRLTDDNSGKKSEIGKYP